MSQTINNSCDCAQASKLLNKIVALLECDITKNDIPRLLELLYDYIALSQYGFYVSDLDNIMRLLEISNDRIKDVPTFKDVITNVLTICKIPPFMKVCSDVLRYSEDIREYFAVLGYILLLQEDLELQKLIIETISCLLTSPAKHKNQLPLRVRRAEVALGRFPGLIGQALFLLKDELFYSVLGLILSFALDCPNACKDLAINDALNSLFTRMEGTWRSRYPNTQPNYTEPPIIEHLNTTLAIINIITNYLSNHREIVKDVPLITRFSLWNIKYVFHYVTLVSKWATARNNLMTCIMYIVDIFPEIDFVPSGLAESLIIDGLTAAQAVYDLMWKKDSDSGEGYYFIKAFLLSMPLYLRYPQGKSVFEKYRVVNKTLRLITARSNQKPLVEHACEVRSLAFKVFNKIVPYLEEEFIENSGPVLLLNLLKSLDTSPASMTIALNCLDTIRCVLRTDTKKFVANSILFNDGFNILMGVLKNIMNQKVFGEKAQICLEEIFCILSKLFLNTDVVMCDLNDLVEVPMNLLDRFLHPDPEEPIYDNRILINMMNFIWEVIVKNKVSHPVLFSKNGVYILLDVVQAFNLPVQIITLGALVDLVIYSDGKCIPYMITWKGTSKMTFFPLLMEIFRQENKLLGVKTGPNGEILDGDHPLMGEQQYIETFEKKNFKISPTISDMAASCRPKIYALLALINERYKDIFEGANEAYKTCNEELSPKDKMTLLLAENYLGLKFGEAWEELKCEFEVMNFTPLTRDGVIMTSLVERTHRWGQKLKEVQEDLIYNEKMENFAAEHQIYSQLRNGRISAALESINEAKYIARCTERMFRISQKYTQINQVDKSMSKITHGPMVHKTFMSTIPITRVFKQNVFIKSDFKDGSTTNEKIEDWCRMENQTKPPKTETKTTTSPLLPAPPYLTLKNKPAPVVAPKKSVIPSPPQSVTSVQHFLKNIASAPHSSAISSLQTSPLGSNLAIQHPPSTASSVPSGSYTGRIKPQLEKKEAKPTGKTAGATGVDLLIIK